MEPEAEAKYVYEQKQYEVRGGRKQKCHLIPYIGNKSGFSDIFDELIPDNIIKKRGRIIDVFGGSGAFATYCSYRFGSENITYNDNNPVLVNFMTTVRDDAYGLIDEYEKHSQNSSNEYFLKIRTQSLTDGLAGAGRFLYLAKNAFSGKIRFNKKNIFNAPMRKVAKCSSLSEERLCSISAAIRDITITNNDYADFSDMRDAFLYLDPPYMNNQNQHYNGVPATESFAQFVHKTTHDNHIMISEQNKPETLKLPTSYRIYRIALRRSLQYVTQTQSSEIIAINYDPAPA